MRVMNSGPFLKKFPRKDFIYIYKKTFSGEVKGTFDVRGKGIHMVYQQQHMESPPGTVARILPRPAAQRV